MADHLDIVSYKKSFEKITKAWGEVLKKCAAELKKIDDELAKLGHKPPIKDYAKLAKTGDKKVKDLVAKRDKIKKQVEQTADQLTTNLFILPFPSKAPEKELIKLPDWIKIVIKRGGIPLGKYASFRPDASFDSKKKKLKTLGISVSW